MTKQEAKTLALEILTYYLEHPEAKSKEDLPKALFGRIKDMKNSCPMCELFYISGCPKCPLRAVTGYTCNDFSTKSLQKNIAILSSAG
jgi:hypothetical protein